MREAPGLPHGSRPVAPPTLPDDATGDVEIAGHRHFAEWAAAVRDDAAGATATQQAVLATLEQRRRAHDHALRACFGGDTVGNVDVRFAVRVTASDTGLSVGDAQFVEVADGPPLDDATARCLEAQLAGADVIHGPGLLPRYRGRIAYVARFGF